MEEPEVRVTEVDEVPGGPLYAGRDGEQRDDETDTECDAEGCEKCPCRPA